ncbi:MAG: hypothetical protein ACW98Y_16030 [Candidatus Thorarchaeota archaeon]
MSPSRQVKGIAVAAVIVTVFTLSAAVLYITAPGPLNGIKVAIYTDRGVDAPSRIALESMFTWMGAETTIIGHEEVENSDLALYDILAMPGGCWCDERCQIQGEKMEFVRDFVVAGGAYFGIDGGAFYATDYRLNLFPGRIIADANGTGLYLLEMNINTTSMGPDLSLEPTSYTMCYESSGYFETDDWTGITPICSYTDTGLPNMVTFEYSNGRVFLSSPHPEFEEGTMRDGTEAWDTLTDPDSEWDFMLKICQWLLE